jgi:cysteinyl-tRNA synthetase
MILFLLCSCAKEESNGEEILNPNDAPLELIGPTSVTLNNIQIENWMYQLQNLFEKEAVDALAATQYDMLVVEPGFNFSEYPYNVDYLVQTLKFKPNGQERILLAYIDIGQAEDYRDYWQDDWIAPNRYHQGYPDFLITIDPDGWSGNYPTAYWDKEWQNIWLQKDGIIAQLAEFGFDGVYLDWVEAYDDDTVRKYAESEDVDPAMEMLNFIEKIGKNGQQINSNFLVIIQNAPYLLDVDPEYYITIIDGIATEDTWFYGKGDVGWNNRKAGDLTGGERHSEGYTTEDRIRQNQRYLKLGIPVFTVDYCINENNAKEVYIESRKYGFIPLVTRVSLSRITETPPFLFISFQND